MRFLAVHARAFGPFVDRTFLLRPGMNVICGPNEAGKSSLHAAIYAGLCGMRRARGPSTKEDREFAERHRPWSGDDWKVEVDLELENDRRIQITQDLANLADCRVIDLQTGRDMMADLENEGTPDGAKLLGLSRKTLPATIFIRQAEMLRVLEDAGELQDYVQRAASTGRADQTAERAIASLARFRSEHVGTARANSTKPLRKAKDRVEETGHLLETARSAHAEYLQLVEQRSQARVAANHAETRRRALQRAIALRDIMDLEGRLERARELWERFTDGEPPSLSNKLEQLGRVRDALTSLDNRSPEPRAPEGATAAEIDAELQALPELPIGDTELSPEVAGLEDRWRTARQAVSAHEAIEPPVTKLPDSGELSASELRALAERLEVQTPSVDSAVVRDIEELRGEARHRKIGAPRIVAFVVGVILAAVGSLTTALGEEGLRLVGFIGALGGVALLVTAALWRRRTSGETALEDRMRAVQTKLEVQRAAAEQVTRSRCAAEAKVKSLALPVDPAKLRNLAATIEDTEVNRRSRTRWEKMAAELKEIERQEATTFRRLLLAKIDHQKNENRDVESLLQTYRQTCTTNARQADLAGRRSDLERTLTLRCAAEATYEQDRRHRREVEETVRQVATDVGITETNLEAIVGGLHDLKTTTEQLVAARQSDQVDWGTLQELLDGKTVDELADELNRMRRVVPAAVEGIDDPQLGDDVDAQLVELEIGFLEAYRLRDSLDGQVVEREQTMPTVSAAEEAHRRAGEEESRVQGLDTVLERTLAFMTEARDRVQRDIAPRLAELIQSRLPDVTTDRYHEAIVDPATLEVLVRPRGGDWRKANHISHGTCKQVYLLARLALAEHLVTTGETAPLVFDDVTVQSDQPRTVAFLDLLLRISQDRQVILFSQEQEVLAWATDKLFGPENQLVKLTLVEC